MTVRTSRGPWIMLALAGVLAIVFSAIATPLLVRRDANQKSVVLGPVPSLSLIDQANQPLTERTLLGHVTVIDFIFTRCDKSCPLLTSRLAEVAARTASFGPKIQFLSITVDPAFDTPALLADFATRWGIDTTRWRFATTMATEAAHRQLIETGFITAVDPATVLPNGSLDILHGEHLLISDGRGFLHGPYDSSVPDRMDHLVYDARAMVLELPAR